MGISSMETNHRMGRVIVVVARITDWLQRYLWVPQVAFVVSMAIMVAGMLR